MQESPLLILRPAWLRLLQEGMRPQRHYRCGPQGVHRPAKCAGCGRCIGVCPVDAVASMCDEANDILNMKIAEYSLAVLKGRPNFHVSLVVDVSPNCDCHSENDAPIVPNIGMFASFDPVAWIWHVRTQ